jgi:hypothetical protein
MPADSFDLPAAEVRVPVRGFTVPPGDSPPERRVYGLLFEVFVATRERLEADEGDEAEGLLREVLRHLRPKGHPVLSGWRPVVLSEDGWSATVLGKVKHLTKIQFKVIKKLVEAGDAGLSRTKLEEANGDARKILRELRDHDSGWQAVIRPAGKPGGVYRIVNPRLRGDPT